MGWEQTEVTQAAARAKEDSAKADQKWVTTKSQRRIRSSASQVVAQLQFIFSCHGRRTLYGKEVRDPISFFKALDQDGSGKVHPCEMAAGLKRLDVPMTAGD